jgi:hypothetical protein
MAWFLYSDEEASSTHQMEAGSASGPEVVWNNSFVSLYSCEISKLQVIHYEVFREMIGLKKDGRSVLFKTVC